MVSHVAEQDWLSEPRMCRSCCVLLFPGFLCQAWRLTFPSSSSTSNVRPVLFTLKWCGGGFPAPRLMFHCCFAADDLSSQDQFEVPEAGGWDAILNGEDEDDFFDLQIVKHYDSEVGGGRLF